MKYIDCHCHMQGKIIPPEELLKKLDAAGMEAVEVMSFAPPSLMWAAALDCPRTPSDRLKFLVDFGSKSDRIFTMFWIDPTDEDAMEQVDRAVEAGVTGFKVICDHYYPCDDRPMQVFAHIAETGKPLHCHSGILYSPHVASRYNRPVWFEDLLEIPKLRFALAHVSWPWVDECLAVYGHWQSMKKRGQTTAEMFIDTTPGTPKIYREEMLMKLYNVGYDIENNVMLGIDNRYDYNVEYCRQICSGDEFLLSKLCVTEEQRNKYFWKNYYRFIGREA